MKEAKRFPLLAQTMSFIFFILGYLPSLVYSCIDPNNAVVKNSIGKEEKKMFQLAEGEERGEKSVNQNSS